jgi:hypothetical protein
VRAGGAGNVAALDGAADDVTKPFRKSMSSSRGCARCRGAESRTANRRQRWSRSAVSRSISRATIGIGYQRQKLGDDPANPRYISKEPGVGYRLLETDGT